MNSLNIIEKLIDKKICPHCKSTDTKTCHFMKSYGEFPDWCNSCQRVFNDGPKEIKNNKES